jgi:uncharacterized membrane protein YeaQ/YmgE (transglycosylase-associated protein family)
MNFIIWLIVGSLVGGVAGIIMGTNRRKGLLMNIIVGIVGALLAGIVLTPYFGISPVNQNNFGFPALMVSLLGAIILLAIFGLFNRRGGFRLR